MYLYRGKDIKSREQLKETCLRIIQGGTHSEIYDILPHLRILRSDSFLPPLLELLREGNTDQKAAAALRKINSVINTYPVGLLKYKRRSRLQIDQMTDQFRFIRLSFPFRLCLPSHPHR